MPLFALDPKQTNLFARPPRHSQHFCNLILDRPRAIQPRYQTRPKGTKALKPNRQPPELHGFTDVAPKTSLQPNATERPQQPVNASDQQCQTTTEDEIALAFRTSRLFKDVHFPRNCRAPQKWWSRSGSNRRPQACKASALPTELRPRSSLKPTTGRARMVGQGRFELPTSRLSSARSNQLSY